MNHVKYLSALLLIVITKILFLCAVLKWDAPVFLRAMVIIAFDSITYTMGKRLIDSHNND